jgi:hypothetical protein
MRIGIRIDMEQRYWVRAKTFEHQNYVDPAYYAVRNDGKHFWAPTELELNTFLEPECNCQVPRLKELCPIHHKEIIEAKDSTECEPDWV